MLVLALESSTSSAKALLSDPEKGVVRTESCHYPPEFCKDGVTGTDEVYRLTMEMGRRVAAGEDVAAIALSCVWHSVAICDSGMRPLGNTYSWNFMKPSGMSERARQDTALADRLYRSTGCMPHVTYPRESLRYLRANGLDLRDKMLPSQGGYNFYQMTGEFLEALTILCGMGLVDVNTTQFDDFALEYAGVRRDQFGATATYRDARPLNARAAALLGVSPGIPVVPAHSDGALNQIANCAAVVGRMTFSVGTSGAIRLTTDRPVLPEGHQLWSYFGVTDWMSGAAVSGACNCIDWFREKFMGGRMSFAELDLGEELPGRMPVFLPFLFGERNPGWNDGRMGGFVDIRPEHTALEMYRALQMGILFNIYQCYEVLTQNVGVPQEIYVSGGILNSRRWTQMAADIFGTRMLCVKNLNASCAGAAVLAMHAAGVMDDVRAYTRDIEDARVVAPRAEYTERYRKLYERYLWYYDRTSHS